MLRRGPLFPGDSSSRRSDSQEDQSLSRRAPRSSRNFQVKHNQNEKVETFADVYFKENPDAEIDLDSPEIKLQKLEDRLQLFDVDNSEKFQILIKIKAMTYILYGEDSVQSLRIHARLGKLYNDNHRPQSALRHLQKAQDLSGKFHVDQSELISIAVETAEAHLSLRSDNKQESQKHTSQAMEILSPYVSVEIKDLELKYRRDLANARSFTAAKKYEQALEQYLFAKETLQQVDNSDSFLQLAKLYVEISDVAESMKDKEKVQEYACLAYEMFLKLGMSGSAQIIKDKVDPEKKREIDNMYPQAESTEFFGYT